MTTWWIVFERPVGSKCWTFTAGGKWPDRTAIFPSAAKADDYILATYGAMKDHRGVPYEAKAVKVEISNE